MRQVLVFVAAMSFLTGVLAGCATDQHTLNERVTNLALVTKKPADATYVVDAPDSIRVEFMNDPTLTRDATIRSDGTVTLPIVEDVPVAGMTTIAIKEKLEGLYSRYYKEPKILVSVSAYRSKRIYVYGEVGRKGTMPYTGSQTVADVIGDAGGVSNFAATTRVKVIRGDLEHPEVFYVNLDKLLLEGDTSQNVSLAENDVVRVPPTVFAWIGYRIDELLFPFRGIIGLMFTSQQLQSAAQTTQGL